MTRDKELTSTSDVWLRAAFRLLSIVLLVLLVVGTTAILLLNALYDYDELRPHQLWRPVLYRNAILSVPCLGLLYFSRLRTETPVAPAMSARITALSTRLLRGVLWVGLAIVAIAEAAGVAENVLFHQTLTPTRTPAQTLNLLYSVLTALLAAVYLGRTRASAHGRHVFIEPARKLRSLLWHALKISALFGVSFGAVFAVGAFVFFKAPGPYVAVLAGAYVLAGVLCGGLVGGIVAARNRTEQIVRGSYSLAEPLIQTLLRPATMSRAPDSSSDAIPPVSRERPPGVLAKLAQWQFRRSMRGHWIADLLHDDTGQGTGAGESLEQLVGERLVRLTIDDIRGRLRLMLWAAHALAAILWWAPAWLALLV